MIRYLTLDAVKELQRQVIEQSGGSHGIRDQDLLDSAVTQPMMAFGGLELYPTADAHGQAAA
jgi:death on curing protein